MAENSHTKNIQTLSSSSVCLTQSIGSMWRASTPIPLPCLIHPEERTPSESWSFQSVAYHIFCDGLYATPEKFPQRGLLASLSNSNDVTITCHLVLSFRHVSNSVETRTCSVLFAQIWNCLSKFFCRMLDKLNHFFCINCKRTTKSKKQICPFSEISLLNQGADEDDEYVWATL